MISHTRNLMKKGNRLDGRPTDQYRKPLKIETGVAKQAEGSALVTIGETMVLAGVKMEVSSPFSDTPTKGNIMIGSELLPLSNPEFENGPPSIQSIELSRVIDRGIRESETLDQDKLCITPGEKVWTVCIDICPLNDAGNLFDAGALAAMAALKDVKLPEFDGTKVNYKVKTDKSLPLNDVTVACTVIKIGESYLVDPTTEEEKALDSRLTCAFTSDGQVCALQKGGEFPLTGKDIDSMVALAKLKCDELRKLVQ
jgi:exosome complex component RRP42